MFRRSGPETFGDHHQFRLLPGANQTVGILMMRKVRATGPPDEADIREMAVHTVVLIGRAGILQRLDNARHRNFVYRIGAAWQTALH